jgi:trimeric autotransporter adhesin
LKKFISALKIQILFQLLFVGFGNHLFAQALNRVADIKKGNSEVRLNQIRERVGNEWQRERQEALNYANRHDLPLRVVKNGVISDLVKIDKDGILIYFTTLNINAAKSTRTDFLNIKSLLGQNFLGQNMNLGVWDGDHPRVSHREFLNLPNRIIIGDTNDPVFGFHASHVTGTISVSGVDPRAMGMAPMSRIKAYDWFNDIYEVTNEVIENGLLLSNHSYGFDSKKLSENNFSFAFGAYISTSKDWDELMYAAPYYLMVVSAGNDGRNDYNKDPLDPTNPEYDKLSGMATSKNNLVIAAANAAEINSQGELINVSMASFSSQGPTDDIRIKPDLTGQGVNLFSTGHKNDEDYFYASGTSMSAPNVSGTLLLIQEASERLNQKFLKSATLKGLALHSADNIGQPGPDAISGWGLLNAKKAVEILEENGTSSRVFELNLEPNQEFKLPVLASGLETLMVSISWTDPAGDVRNEANNSTPVLVHDLDVKVTDSKGTDFYPWRLIAVNQNANNSSNLVDPFERVDILNPDGDYVVTVSHKGTLKSAQDFSLIITGLALPDTTPPVVSVKNIEVFLDDNGQVSIQAEDVDNGTTDDSGFVILSLSKSSFSCEDIGVNTIIFFAADAAGNTSNQEVEVTITDNTAPVVQAKSKFILALDGEGAAALTQEDIDEGSTDNCGIALRTLSKTKFSCADLGVQTITYSVTDTNGNVSSATIEVTVIDNTAPVVQAKSKFILVLDGEGAAVLTIEDIDEGSTDNCGISESKLSQTDFSCDDLGLRTITYSVTDTNGNVSSATIEVTVIDNAAPVVQAKSKFTLVLDGEGAAVLTIEDIDEGSTDNCGIALRTLSKTKFSCADIGTQTITYSIRDNGGNVGNASIQVTVVDTTVPVLKAKSAITLTLDSSGRAMLNVEDIDEGSTDNCGIVLRTLSKTKFSCADLGVQTITYSVTDTNGNVSSATIEVTVIDTTVPVVQAKSKFTLVLDGEGAAVLTIEDIDEGSTDNCGISLRILSKTKFSCADIGTQTITYSIRDNGGNVGNASIQVTVVDTTVPVLKAKSAITLTLDSSGRAMLNVEDIDEGSTDNCGIAERVFSKTFFDEKDLGENFVTYSIIDSSGNSSRQRISVIVEILLSINDKLTTQVSIKVFPNPAKDYLIIDFGENIDLLTPSLSLIDVSGRIMPSVRIIKKEDQRITIDTSDMISGVYFLGIYSYRYLQTKKIIIRK